MRGGRRSSVLTTLVFTDIVSSTALAEEMGDRRWRELLARHHQIIRGALREHQGKELDTAGDGVFARFESPAAAVRWASDVVDNVRDLGIEIRVGIHIGEAEVLHGKLSGLNVHAAARTMAEAGPGEILVTRSVRDIVRGSGFGFDDRGVHELRGIEGEWQLFEVTSLDGTPRPARPSDEEAKARRDAIVPPPLVKRRRARWLVAALTVGLVLAGVGLGLAFTSGGKKTALTNTACEVAPYPPLNDHAFNQAVFDGLTDAATTWGISVRDKVTDPPSEAGAKKNIEAFARQRCGLIVTVGGFMGPVTAEVARKNPDLRFLTTDDEAVRDIDNLANVVFRIDQAAFLAGYLAAGVTKTDTVATFGGIEIPTVTSFLRGFAAGVLRYNRMHARRVELLGWDTKKGLGTYLADVSEGGGVFDDAPRAAIFTRNLIRAGADVIMPVDGTAGELGAGRAVRASREQVLLIGVDTDQHYSHPQFVDLWLTSVLKVYRRMVYVAMGKVVHGEFHGGVMHGTLANGGVARAPFYGLSSRVSGELRRELEDVKKGVIDGSISLDPASYA